MKVTSIKIKLFGKTETMFRVLNAAGEVLQVFDNKPDADDWIAAQ